MSYPVLATDEELLFDHLAKQKQPGARVRRFHGDTATDEEMIQIYTDIVAKLPSHERTGVITTHLNIALRGRVCGTERVSQRLVFALPPSEYWLPGRPLSALHFVPQFNKRYSELDENEVDIVDIELQGAIVRLVGRVVQCDHQRTQSENS